MNNNWNRHWRTDILCVRVMRPEPVFCVLLGANMAANVGCHHAALGARQKC